MEKFNLWSVRHKGLATFLLSLILCSIYTLPLVLFDGSIIFIVITNIVMIFASFCFAMGASARVIMTYLRELDNGDPYPFMNILETLLKAEKHEPTRITLLINYGVALRSVGKYEETLEVLESINIDKFPAIAPATKYIYYNNLADIYTLTDKVELANLWHSKAKQAAVAVKGKKLRQKIELILLCSEATDHLRNGRYAEAIHTAKIIYEKPNRTARLNVGIGMVCAEAYIKLGDVAQARSMLGNVIKYGGKLYEVTEARRMLSELDGESRS